MVKRGVVRLVTPGTLTEESLLDARKHNYLAAYSEVRDEAALAWVDISTGAFRVMPTARHRLSPELARLAPRELLLQEELEPQLAEIVTDCGAASTPLGRGVFDSSSAKQRLTDLFKVKSLDAYGSFSRAELGAMGALVEYLDITQKGKLPLLQPPVREMAQASMQIDAATRRNLELTHALSGGREGSLLSVIDSTVTAGGSRLLERRLSSPSCNIDEINARLACVSFFVENSQLSAELRNTLRRVPDMDRALSRLGIERGGPRDLTAIRSGIQAAKEVSQLFNIADLPPKLNEASGNLLGHDELSELLQAALVEEPPILAREGGFIAPGYHPDLDEARQLRDEGRGVIASMQAQYSEHTGITTLKIKHNNVLGYFIETTATHAEKMLGEPLSEHYIHRQTTANAVRFTTVALSDMETKILNARNHALEIEKKLYGELVEVILSSAAQIALTARALSELDLNSGFADLARAQDWCAPTIDNSLIFNLEGARHPVVEAALKQSGEPFIANDCDLSDGTNAAAIWLLTGPNMAGKSTFLRQNALIALLAQSGSFVPARSAHIGVVSQLFSRVGASDDLARGRSTFMVEMVETAAILNQADDRALVILDEIGRGTATYDGLSIAWATLEHLHEANRCRALFATHYHEMTQLANKLDGVENATVAVKEWEGDVVFLHEVRKGAADRSYGVQVAKLAGLPESVIARASVVLQALEKGEREGGSQKAIIDDLPLFAAAPPPQPAPPSGPSILEEALSDVQPDTLRPLDALNLIYQLKELVDK